jgi:hypothetical protein
MRRDAIGLSCVVWGAALAACCPPPEEEDPKPKGWSVLIDDAPAPLWSVQSAAGAVWVVGADRDGADGPDGPTVLVDDDPTDAEDFVSVDVGVQGDLWWVHPVSAEVAWASGSHGRVLRIERVNEDTFETTAFDTPGSAQADPNLIVFGVYASSDDDVWAVGGRTGGASGGFLWRSQAGAAFVAVDVPTELEGYALWKVAGRGASDVWIVGTSGLAFHFDGASLTPMETGLSTSLFTVDVNGSDVIAVGGLGRGVVVRRGDGDDAWQDLSPDGDSTVPLLGVHRRGDKGLIVGTLGVAYRIDDGVIADESFGFLVQANLHSCNLDENGYAWAVGGQHLLRRAP